MSAGIETKDRWVVCPRLQLDAVELDRWLRQRCSEHARSFQMWCQPEWEPFDPAKHNTFLWVGKPPETAAFGDTREMGPLPR